MASCIHYNDNSMSSCQHYNYIMRTFIISALWFWYYLVQAPFVILNSTCLQPLKGIFQLIRLYRTSDLPVILDEQSPLSLTAEMTIRQLKDMVISTVIHF